MAKNENARTTVRPGAGDEWSRGGALHFCEGAAWIVAESGTKLRKFDSLAPARSALAGLWLCPMELPLLPSVSHDWDCRYRDKQTFRRFPSGSSR